MLILMEATHCPPLLISAQGTDVSTPNPAYSQWIQQGQMILSLLISSLSEETLPIAIGLNTSKAVWDALEAALSSSSNTRILNLHMQLQNLKQDDLTVTQYLHKAKLISDELAAAGRPLCLADQNIYIFKELRYEFKDIVTTLSARPEPVTFSELHSLILYHEFINGSSISNMYLSSATLQNSSITEGPSANLAQCNTPSDRPFNTNSNRGRGRSYRGCGGRDGRFYLLNYSNNTQFWQSHDQRQKCQICNGSNHLASTCFQRYSPNRSPAAYLSYQSLPPVTPQWYHTGATHHITLDLTNTS
uniref:Retrovirus-related Pol polyprotein from transposon TNT 1-94 n=1 Tax=Nicotiana tabacum TaxID=4097 RepID=A0A1S3YPI3_TOBAC|nr:PREDICTED: uncharacterized protein LOC107778192 [Nicotiana tabacum]